MFLASLLDQKFLRHQLVIAVRVVILVAIHLVVLVAVQDAAFSHVPDIPVAATDHLLDPFSHEIIHVHDPHVVDVTGPAAVISRALFVVF